MSIKQLPPDVVAKIKSSIAISSLNSVILGLVENSLDAHASKITVSVDYRRGNCTVEDDGLGIAPAEFLENGGLGKLHYTSKYPAQPAVHGIQGTFLASVAALSLLSITSHHHEHRSHNSLSIHNSKVLARNTPAPPEQRLLAFPHGTRVTVRDLFGSMPVRVKRRGVEMEKAGSAKELEQLVLGIVCLLLVWPDKVSVVVRDAASSNMLSLRTKESSTASDSGDDAESSSLLERAPRLLAQASLYDDSDRNLWVKVGAKGFGVSVRGCVCLVPTATKRLQFLAVGIQPLLNEHGANVLYEEVNGVFANSAFGVIEGESDEDAPGKEPRKSFRSRDLKARKGIDRWPIFALQIQFDDKTGQHTSGVEEILDGRSPDLTAITNLLRALTYQFLKRHNFRPKPVNSILHNAPAGVRSRTPAASPSQARPSSAQPTLRRRASSVAGHSTRMNKVTAPERRSESPFGGWSRVKVGRPLSALPRPATVPLQTPMVAPLMDSTGKLLRKPFDDDVPTLSKSESRSDSDTLQKRQRRNDGTDFQSDTVVWVDPITNVRSTIDSRTGFVVQSNSTANKRVSLRPSSYGPGQANPEPPAWIKEMQSNWNNPAYAPTEAPIPRIPDPVEATTQPTPGGVSHSCGHMKFGDASEKSMLQFSGRVSKQALQEAQVIAQVDSKFILVKLALQRASFAVETDEARDTGASGELLVLIDQHAADERCRVEELQRAYFASADAKLGAHTQQLDRPIQFELRQQEGLLLARFREHFEYWGIVYEVQPLATAAARGKLQQLKTKVEIHSLPPSILERCRLEPRLLIELVRKEAWRLRDEPGLVVSAGVGHGHVGIDGEKDWVRRFHGCPQGILDLINSRSCRSAIMFNDHLSKEQCRELVSRLADCVFPFQCAHGRPSMVPLIDLGRWTDFRSS